MKRIFAGLVLALGVALAHATTLSPIQLLNPAGSTAGQAILSTGPSGVPAWGTVALLSAANTWSAAQTFSVRPIFNGATPYDTANLTIASYQTKAGVTDGSNASAGQIGEVISSSFTALNVPTANAALNLTSITLTAGDWDVTGFASYAAAATTTLSYVICGANTTSATLPAAGQYFQLTATYPVNATAGCHAPVTRINVSSSQTIYLVGQVGFGTSTLSANGFLRARRIR